MKYIVVTGSVMSGIGKGITASSFGVVLKGHGLKVTAIKIDPYLNPDCGTMSPFEHGECYVLNDGGETDLDLGNYERFLGISLTRDHNITTGKIYSKVIQEEREGKFLGKTVQIIPHITNEIQEWIHRTARLEVEAGAGEPDVCIIELGGTIGDFESAPYAEALRQMSFSLGQDNVFFVNVCYVPVLEVSNEAKTKPAQAGIRELRRHGINPDVLVVRGKRSLEDGGLDKLSNICQIPPENILMNQNVSNIYQIPIIFHERDLFSMIDRKLKLGHGLSPSLDFWKEWQEMASRMDGHLPEAKVAIIGKYTGLADSYLSLLHAIKHAGMKLGVHPVIEFVESDELKSVEEVEARLGKNGQNVSGVIIPGGFGQRGIEGMILGAQWARENQIPCLGICLGFQVQVMEYARHCLGLAGANSTEFDPETPHPVVVIMEEDQKIMGGTMRLGEHVTRIKDPDSLLAQLYDGSLEFRDRHRHRYEVNPKYVSLLEEKGDLSFSGIDLTGERMGVLELNNHPFYLGTQFHGEYLTRPMVGHPIFNGWMEAVVN